jgi:hypothetical protein
MHFEYVKGRKGEGENPPSLKLRRSKKATVDRGGGEWGKKRRRGEEEKRRRGDEEKRRKSHANYGGCFLFAGAELTITDSTLKYI